MARHVFTEASVKKLQMVSGLLDVMVDLIAQGAHVQSEIVLEILHELVHGINDTIKQIEDQKNENSTEN